MATRWRRGCRTRGVGGMRGQGSSSILLLHLRLLRLLLLLIQL